MGLIFSIGFWNCSDIVVFLFFVSFHSFILVQCCLYVWIFVLCLVHSVVCMSGFSFCVLYSVACMSGFSFCVLYTVLPVCLDFCSVSCTVLPVCLDFPYLIAPLLFSNVYLHFVNRGPFWETTKFVSICFCHCGKDIW